MTRIHRAIKQDQVATGANRSRLHPPNGYHGTLYIKVCVMALNNVKTNSVHAPQGFSSAIEELLRVRDLSDPSEQIEIAGIDPFYKTPFKVGESVAAPQTMLGIAVNDWWEIQHGNRQSSFLNVCHVAAHLRTVGYPPRQNEPG